MARCGCSDSSCACVIADSPAVTWTGDGSPGTPYQAVSVVGSVFVNDTDCIALAGDGTIVTPLEATPIIPATVDHPLLPGPVPLNNGISCEADGLQVQPWGQPNDAFAQQLSGTIPTILADTAPGPGPNGSILWGPRLDLMLTNLEVSRPCIILSSRTYPTFSVILDAGARVEIYGELYSTGINMGPGTLTPFLSEVVWSVTNTGAGVARWDWSQSGHEQQLGGAFSPGTFGDFEWSGIQMYVKVTGAGASTAIGSGLLGSGTTLNRLAVPV